MSLFDPDEAAPVALPAEAVRVALVVAYDGRGFHGFAANVGVRTVAGTVTEALARVLGHPVALTCAGRTDKGVHARGQVVTFDADLGRVDDLAALVRSVNALCGPEIALRRAEVVPGDFDARFSATARRYRYQVLASPVPDPFLAATAWHVATELSVPVMNLGCDPLIGEHDFSAFCRRPKRRDGEEASLVRRVIDAAWHTEGDGGELVVFEIEAGAFCHQMVRAIVGTLVDVGRGRRRAGEVRAILEGGDRAAAGDLAPSHGLCLETVRYPDWSSS